MPQLLQFSWRKYNKGENKAQPMLTGNTCIEEALKKLNPLFDSDFRVNQVEASPIGSLMRVFNKPFKHTLSKF